MIKHRNPRSAEAGAANRAEVKLFHDQFMAAGRDPYHMSSDIAEATGLCRQTVCLHLRALGIPPSFSRGKLQDEPQTISAGLHLERSLPPTIRIRAHQNPTPRPDYTDQDMLRVSIETGGIRIDRIGEVMPWLVK